MRMLDHCNEMTEAQRDVLVTLLADVAGLFPRFAILGNFGHRSDEPGSLPAFRSQFWSFIPGVRWPILSGGRIRANIRVHDARLDQARRQYESPI